MSGKLYGVGVGPGDPGLITLKAKNVLEEVDFICVPQSGKREKSLAWSIIDEIVNYRGVIQEMYFPMTSNRPELKNAWNKAAAKIVALLNQNYNLAFITLGDPLLYSTYNYILKIIKGYKNLEIETIPGINSINAVAARLNLPLTEGDEKLVILPLPSKPQELEEILVSHENIAFMKVSRNYDLLLTKLKKYELLKNSYLVSYCGQKNESIIMELASYSSKKIPYLSLVIVKKG